MAFYLLVKDYLAILTNFLVHDNASVKRRTYGFPVHLAKKYSSTIACRTIHYSEVQHCAEGTLLFLSCPFVLVYFKEGARETSIRRQEWISRTTMETNFEGGEGKGSRNGRCKTFSSNLH